MASEFGTRLKKGDRSPSMEEAEFVNKRVLDPIQALSEMTSSPAGIAKIVMKGPKAFLVIDVEKLSESLTPPTSKIDDVYIMINGARFLTNLVTDGRLDPA